MSSLFVGIAGPSCSGKTTVVKKIVEGVGKRVELIHLDDYWNRNFEPRQIDGYKNRETPDNLELDLLFKHLKELKSGRAIEIPFNVFEVEKGKKVAKPRQIILVEGFLLFYEKKIRDLFDLKIYINLSDEEVFRRRALRCRNDKERDERYTEIVIGQYMKYGLPTKEYCDLILDGSGDVDENVGKVLREIAKFKSRLE